MLHLQSHFIFFILMRVLALIKHVNKLLYLCIDPKIWMLHVKCTVLMVCCWSRLLCVSHLTLLYYIYSIRAFDRYLACLLSRTCIFWLWANDMDRVWCWFLYNGGNFEIGLVIGNCLYRSSINEQWRLTWLTILLLDVANLVDPLLHGRNLCFNAIAEQT